MVIPEIDTVISWALIRFMGNHLHGFFCDQDFAGGRQVFSNFGGPIDGIPKTILMSNNQYLAEVYATGDMNIQVL